MGRPVIAITAETLDKPKGEDTTRYYQIMAKYVAPVVDLMGALPLLLPPIGDQLDTDTLLARVDGVLLTGGVSNVEPRHYQGGESYPGCPHDPDRDATVLPLVKKIIERGVPLFGICRGFQEMNIAFGGSLYQQLHIEADFALHKALVDFDAPADGLYADVHELNIAPDGILARITNGPVQRVNSIHGQGIKRLGDGLRVEGTSPDGLIEAFSVENAKAFALGVQWHPEWKPTQNPMYQAMWEAFGQATRAYAEGKQP
ncbi:gamma-glutamyl-gamma-aminobutyrate hydrolase family protein [Simiduia sp. 21SJ11W-1]|uniref:gamma-glutamyl-gamma-aminobutyrate hydrolase family protein n=1 Tax=Simiduia sp. 21SJ11W-1 TaxID=2909669 RepID=UPI0020A04261|nr:gamma-glutamyl-gamma-aminobutyrate hydrolase family protein [Simiduia sp. 21SJ11W-1]UTA46641.1 gamma-glutamyl-gamma-aminobutyrate hydrolase family protein [Simiduia sp. 21SJ11W-1]